MTHEASTEEALPTAARRAGVRAGVAGEEYQRRLREEFLVPWNTIGGKFQRPRVMTEDQWARLKPFLDSMRQGRGRQPVLYAVVDGEADLGSFWRPVRRVTILLVVDRDGTVDRYGWRPLSAFDPDRLALSDIGKTAVANVGGVPVRPELTVVRARNAYAGLLCHRVQAREGTVAADVVRALHLDAAQRGRTNLSRQEPWPEVAPVWVPPPPPVAQPTASAVRSRMPAPRARLVRDGVEAEELAASWVRWMGWPDAEVTPPGADAGVDVVGHEIVGQVKFEAVKTGRPTLQALYGAGHAMGASNWLFFSSAGYTAQAVAWADRVDMALFRFTLDGAVEPTNAAAARMLASAGR